MSEAIERVQHGRVSLALHRLTEGEGPGLLCVHELLGDASQWRTAAAAWPGPVCAVDLAGHGASERMVGGFYSPELFAADVDCALAHCGARFLVGAGIGAYAALLVAAARREALGGALLLPGRGIAGGGPAPDFQDVTMTLPEPTPEGDAPDAFAHLAELEVRPTDYAGEFAEDAAPLHFAPLADAPPWWLQAKAQAREARDAPAELAAALAQLRGAAG